jgi:SPP1 gp7 family putative phage head morphogenesis protein
MSLDYFAEMVKLALAQRRLENGAAQDLIMPLRRSFGGLLSTIAGDDRVQRLDPRALMPDVRTYKEIGAQLDDLVISTADEVSDRFIEIVKRQAGARLDAVSVARSRELYKSITINGKTIAEHLEAQRLSMRERLQSDMRRSIQLGETYDQLRERLRGNVFGTAIAQANSLLRTAVGALSALLLYETAFENRETFAGYFLLVILDGRTSKICLGHAAEHRLYAFKGTSPKPPFHFNCRTSIMPVWDEFDGEIPEDGDAWLKSQPIEVQEDVLGVAMAEKYRAGKLKLERLARDETGIELVSKHRRSRRKVTLGIDVDRLRGMLNEKGRARLARLLRK